jgi:putative ABC transport system permease protein
MMGAGSLATLQLGAVSGNDISTWGLVASASLIGLAVVVSLWRRLGIEASIIWAAVRALAQLLLVGVALRLVVEPRQPIIWSILWVVVMLVFAAWSTQRRAPEVPGAFWLSFGAFAAALLITHSVLFGMRVFPISGRTVVPLSGMVVGNSLAATVLVARRIVAEFAEKRLEVEARLALGLSARAAGRPFLRAAVRTGLLPQIETTKAVGIVFLPGAMVGQILAGADPMSAVKVQVAIMYLILGSVAVTTTVVALGLTRRLFSADQRLVHLERTPNT